MRAARPHRIEPHRALSLEPDADLIGEILERLAQILVGSGCPPQILARRFREVLARAPKPAARLKPDALHNFRRAAHVLTHWFQDPTFLTTNGTPRPLPLRARGASIAMLAKQVDGTLDPRRVLDYLVRYRAVRRTRAGWLPRAREVSYRGRPEAAYLHGVLVLLGMLRCVSHNSGARPGERAWFEFIAENARVPLNTGQSLDRRIRASGMRFLQTIDGEMTRREGTRAPQEPTMYVGVGVYHFKMPSMPAAERLRATRKRR